jgi:membrane associated rhomboid family serine protease
MKKSTPMVYLLIIINCMFMYAALLVSHEWNVPTLKTLESFGALKVGAISNSLILHMFLHGSLLHIFMNMMALLTYGKSCEKTLGSFKFLFIYLLCGIGSGLGFLHYSSPDIVAVGASGAICGLIGVKLIEHLVSKTKTNDIELHSVVIDIVMITGMSFIPCVLYWAFIWFFKWNCN